MNDIKYKTLLTFSVPYLAVCGGLWQIGYWSTFDIRILENLNSIDIIKSFIYPFVASAGFFLLGHIISLLIGSHIIKDNVAEDSIPPKRLKIIRIILIIIWVIMIGMAFFIKQNEKWLIITALLATPLSIILFRKGILNDTIPNRIISRNFVFTIVLIPFLCFGFAKTTSLNILDNKTNRTVIITINQSGGSEFQEKYRLIGFVGDFIYVLKMDQNTIIMYPISEVKKIELIKNAP